MRRGCSWTAVNRCWPPHSGTQRRRVLRWSRRRAVPGESVVLAAAAEAKLADLQQRLTAQKAAWWRRCRQTARPPLMNCVRKRRRKWRRLGRRRRRHRSGCSGCNRRQPPLKATSSAAAAAPWHRSSCAKQHPRRQPPCVEQRPLAGCRGCCQRGPILATVCNRADVCCFVGCNGSSIMPLRRRPGSQCHRVLQQRGWACRTTTGGTSAPRGPLMRCRHPAPESAAVSPRRPSRQQQLLPIKTA